MGRRRGGSEAVDGRGTGRIARCAVARRDEHSRDFNSNDKIKNAYIRLFAIELQLSAATRSWKHGCAVHRTPPYTW